MSTNIGNDSLKKFTKSMAVVLGHYYKEFLHYTGGKDRYALSDQDYNALGIAMSNVQAMVKGLAAAQNIAEGALVKRMHNEVAALHRALEMRNHSYEDYRQQAIANTEREIVKLPGKVQNIVKLFKQAQSVQTPTEKAEDNTGVYDQVEEYASAIKGWFEKE